MKVAFFFEFTEVGIQLPCKGHVRVRTQAEAVRWLLMKSSHRGWSLNPDYAVVVDLDCLHDVNFWYRNTRNFTIPLWRLTLLRTGKRSSKTWKKELPVTLKRRRYADVDVRHPSIWGGFQNLLSLSQVS